MAKYKIVHYINQFFAGIGGEEKADYTPELREGVVGPGKGLKAAPFGPISTRISPFLTLSAMSFNSAFP